VNTRRRFGLTTRGSALLTAGCTAALCGIVLGQRDLVRVAVLLIAAPLVAAYIISRARVTVSCTRSATPERSYGGESVRVSISLSNQAILPTGALLLEDTLAQPLTGRARFTLDSLRGRETRTLAYHLPPLRRGRYRVGPLTMRVTDPFGMVERTRSFRAVSDFLVLPVVDQLPDGSLPTAWDVAEQSGSQSVGARGSDDASTREYRDGDDLRKVHWRSTARTGTLMVRQEERPWHSRTTLLLDNRVNAHRTMELGRIQSTGDGRAVDSFEWAVSAIASIAAHLAARGRELELIATSDATRFAGIGQLLDHLATVPTSDRADLDDVSAQFLSGAKRTPGTSLALLLDATAWSPTTDGTAEIYEQRARKAELLLTEAGWRVLRVNSPRASTADCWGSLLAPGGAGFGTDARVELAGAR
jgi:uncharacterized protein (DUF58 family)